MNSAAVTTAGGAASAGRAPGAAGVRHVLATADAVGGVWRYAIDLGRALAARGVRTTVAVMGPAPSEAQRREAGAAGVALVHRTYRLEWMDDPWDDVARAGSWLLALERTLQPDVVHLNGYAHAALPWAAPVVVVAHSCVRTWWRAVKGEAAPPRLERYGASVAAGLRAAGAVVAPTSAMLDGLGREYGVTLRAHVIPNGMPHPASASPDARMKEPIVLAAGRAWDEAKNIAALCEVAPELSWPVYVAGDARAPGGTDCALPAVHALGKLPPDAMAAWYARAAIYALPARYEPFGLSILEAAQAGCALVLGDIGSLRENWDHAAVFVPPGDRARLSAELQALIHDPGRRQQLAERAMLRARTFTMDRTADEYLRVYEDLVR